MAKRATQPDVAEDDIFAIATDALEIQAKHVACRAGFNEEMVRDPRVEDLYGRWARETGLVAELVGLRDLPERERSTEIEAGTLERAFVSRSERVASDALTFVRDTLHLEWPWVVQDLVEAFFCELVAGIFGKDVTREFAVHNDLPAPPFSTRPGERLSEAVDRLIAEAHTRSAVTVASPGRAGRPRLPKSGGADLEEAGRWFYRIRVRGESQSSVAREYTEARQQSGRYLEQDNRSTVRARVKAAGDVLSLTAWVIAPLKK